MTNTQVRKLGDRLRAGNATDTDLRLLNEYRSSFTEAYEQVIHVIRDRRGLAPTGRQAKTTESIVAKLKRERTNLSRMQDIAGCRVVVADIAAQNRTILELTRTFAEGKVEDRRLRPSHGYRAVHVILRLNGKLIEVQIRTTLQHLWAELSEKLSDSFDPSIKYGASSSNAQALLMEISTMIRVNESNEHQLDGAVNDDTESQKMLYNPVDFRKELETVLKHALMELGKVT
ncbi:MAG TPA: hypothetical protein VHD56_06815 [Tepidisphaeraceae bacterium]|nr:hypothetical protein [Tepidisphaeraceae bacterium]